MPTPTIEEFVAESPIHRRPIARAVEAFAASVPNGAAILDAGAGEAPYRPLFAHCEYLTQDWPGTVHPGAKQADVVADLHDLPIEDQRFDAVVCTEVLEHVAEPAVVLHELFRVLKPGGRLFLTVPFVGELHEVPHDHYRYTSYGLEGLLTRAGFEEAAAQPLTGWYSTLAHVLRHAGISTRPPDRPAGHASRTAAFILLVLSGLLQRAAPTLDRLDERHGLPIGWSAQAVRPPA